MLASATAGPRISIRVWRDPAYADKMTQAGRVLPFSYATSRGVTRGTLPLWAGIGFIGAGTLAAAALPSRPVHAGGLALGIGIVCYALGLAAIVLNLWIVWFNAPRRLVPPHMRGEEGLISAWWRCRSLPAAQRQAAARARRRWPARGHLAPVRRQGTAMTAAAGGSVITLSRALGGWRDRFRRYRVVVDGEQVASIGRGQRLDLPVPPGRHAVVLQVDWARSPQLEVDVAPGEVFTLECAPGNVPPPGAGADAYIDLWCAS